MAIDYLAIALRAIAEMQDETVDREGKHPRKRLTTLERERDEARRKGEAFVNLTVEEQAYQIRKAKHNKGIDKKIGRIVDAIEGNAKREEQTDDGVAENQHVITSRGTVKKKVSVYNRHGSIAVALMEFWKPTWEKTTDANGDNEKWTVIDWTLMGLRETVVLHIENNLWQEVS